MYNFFSAWEGTVLSFITTNHSCWLGRARLYWFSEDKKARVFYTRELTIKTGFAQMKKREPLSRLNASDNRFVSLFARF
jgi:hypothetical protein